ncbi:MAG: hypothetical protein JWL66_1367 [Sphingomonadales bacterium]|nr:hypothetical protein [Sphingomonadales bacterium]
MRFPHYLMAVIANCFVADLALAAGPAEPVNPVPTARDWTAISALPDLSGVWSPGPLDHFLPGSTTSPPWKPDQAAQITALQKLETDGTPKNIYVDCLPEGLPSSVTQTLNSAEFLLTPGRLTILGEFDGNRLRRIWTDGRPHPADPDPTFSGHSIGHWEKGVLIVDTIGFLPQVFIPMGQSVGLPNNGDMHIEERIYLTGPDTLQDDIVVHAPKVLTGPWKASRTFTRHRERKYDPVESSCRQGDFIDDVDAHGNAVYTAVPKDAGGARLPPDQAQTPSPQTPSQ